MQWNLSLSQYILNGVYQRKFLNKSSINKFVRGKIDFEGECLCQRLLMSWDYWNVHRINGCNLSTLNYADDIYQHHMFHKKIHEQTTECTPLSI